MDKVKWSRLFALNERLTRLFEALQQDILDVEKTSGLNMNEVIDALQLFAVAMMKVTDTLNAQFNDEKISDERIQEVEDVLNQVKRKLKFKEMFRDERREDRKKTS